MRALLPTLTSARCPTTAFSLVCPPRLQPALTVGAAALTRPVLHAAVVATTSCAMRTPLRSLHTTRTLAARNAPGDAGREPLDAESIVFTFRNANNDAVEINLRHLVGQLSDSSRLALPDIRVPPADDPEGEPVTPEWAEVSKAPVTEQGCSRVYTMACSKKTLDALKEYAEWPPEHRHVEPIPQPMEKELAAYVTAEELAFVQRVDQERVLMELLEAALSVHHDTLAELCAAYSSVRVDEIAKAAPNIMEGAERIRQYLGLKNEWTAEEMKHLENEMKVLKEIDPNAY